MFDRGFTHQAFSKPVTWNEWRSRPLAKDIVVEPEFTNINADEILLGSTSRDYTDAVILPYTSKKRSTIVIVGGQGSGKTVLGQQIVLDNYHYRMGHPVFAVDPRLDWHRIIRPNTNPAFAHIFKKHQVRPHSYGNAHFVAPKFMELLDSYAKSRDGDEVTISFKDFRQLDRDTAAGLLSELLGIDMDEPAYAIVREIIQNRPQTIREVKDMMYTIMEEKKIKSQRLIWKMQNLIDTETISDRDFDYAKYMQEHGIVVMEGATADETTSEYMLQGAFINIAIHKILHAKKVANIGKGMTIPLTHRYGFSNKYPVIWMDEANTFCGEKGRSRGIMVSLSTKYREIAGKAGVTSVVASQYLYELADKIVTEADYIICPKIIERRDLELLKKRGNNINIFDDMHFDRNDPPNEFVVFGRGGWNDCQRFSPFPSCSSMSKA